MYIVQYSSNNACRWWCIVRRVQNRRFFILICIMHMALLLSYINVRFLCFNFCLGSHLSLSLSLSILILHINCACNAAKGPWSNWKFISLAFFVSLSLPRIIPRSVLSFESYYLVGTHAVIMTKFIQHTALTYHSWSGFQPMHAATHVSKFNPFRSSFNLLLFVHIAHPFFISIAHSLFIPN